MKKTLFLMILVCLSVGIGMAQTQSQSDRRIIEVSGSAERMVIPDEFTFKITLIERIENKRKITIEDQETALRVQLNKLGVDVNKDLSIYDISSTYFRQKKLRDVLGTKDYRLKIHDLNKIAQLQDIADTLNVGNLDLIDTDNSRMTEIRREVKVEAVKAAKAKADYLLAAINERTGRALYIDETETSRSVLYSTSASNSFVVDGQETSNYRGAKDKSDGSNLSFTAEKVRFVINAKFEIE